MKLCGCSKFKETLKHKINSNNITRKKEGQNYCLNTSEAHPLANITMLEKLKKKKNYMQGTGKL